MGPRLIAFMIFFASCNYTNSREENTGEATRISRPLTCYALFTEKDSILMRLEIKDNVVTGDLVYNFFEKDDNRGTITGKVKGDTIFASYRFFSEGAMSEREVAFIKKGQTYVEGYGALTERDGKMVFQDKDALDFDSNTILTEIGCLK